MVLGMIGAGCEGGVHTQWLFHGAGSTDVLNSIVNDPMTGFAKELNVRGLWGHGVYFARDSV
jgi:hypothetical protein